MSRKDVYDDGVLNMIPPIIQRIFSGRMMWIQRPLAVLPNVVVLIGSDGIW